MDSLNFIQPSSFIFFILVISIGYIIVEIVAGDNYVFRNSINRYSPSNTMDRLIHYVSIGIIFHLFMIIFLTLMGNIGFFDQILLTGYKFAQGIKFTDGSTHFDALISTQFIVSALVYFLFIIILFLLKIGVGLSNILVKFYQKLNMKRNNKIHRKRIETKEVK